MKTCSLCGEEKALAEFGPDARKRDGHKARCRPCVNDAGRARASDYRRDKVEIQRAKNARWRARNPDRLTELSAKYRALRPDAFREAARKYYYANHDRRLEQMREYRKRNPELLRRLRNQSCARRRARIKGPWTVRHLRQAARRREGLPHEHVDLLVLIEREWSIDHVLPISRGGGNTYLNTRLAHLSCNIKRRHLGAAQLRMV